MGIPFQERPDNTVKLAGEVATGRVPVIAVDHTESNGVSRIEMHDAWIKGVCSSAHDDRSLSQEVSRDPSGADITASGSPPSAPGRDRYQRPKKAAIRPGYEH